MKRIISLVLILTLLCTIPIYAANEQINVNGGTTNQQAESKSGQWRTEYQGMRIYAIDKSGCLVSNVIDVVKDGCYTKMTTEATAKGKKYTEFWTTKTGETPAASKYRIYSETEANQMFFDGVCKLYKEYAENPEVSGIENVSISEDGETLTWDEYARDEKTHEIINKKTQHTVQKSSASIPR